MGAPRGGRSGGFGPGSRMRHAGGRGPKNTRKTIGRLLRYLSGGNHLKLMITVIAIIIGAVAGVVGSMLLKTLIDDHILPLAVAENPDFMPLVRLIRTMIIIYACGVVATFTYNRLIASIAQNAMKEIRDDTFAHLQSLPLAYFDSRNYGDIMSIFTNDVDTLRQLLMQSLPQTFSAAITLVSVLTAMIILSPYLTLIVVAMAIIMITTAKKIAGQSAKYFRGQQEALGATNGYIEEMISGQKVIKVFSHEGESIANFQELNEKLFTNVATANRFANILMPVMGNLAYVQYVVLAMVGGILALIGFGGITLGTIAGFLQLSRTFSMPLSQISQQLNFVVMALAGAERIFALLDEEPETDEGSIRLVNTIAMNGELQETEERTGTFAWKEVLPDGEIKYTPLKGDVRFFDVDFSYDGKKNVLHDISLYARPGEKVALVGATGAGKTTIANLINRFYDLEDDKIKYDGININAIKKADLRHSLGVVLQETHLFSGTVLENIRYGRLDASDEEVIAAAKRANADGFISLLPEGYSTLLEGDGAGLSQGQRQLLAIARAELAEAPVMILDEATSSIDTRTELLVQEGMDSLMKGRTVFVIAHRLSTVQDADVIMVMEEGQIIERGNHEQLVAEGGKYYQLTTGDFDLEPEADLH